MITDPNAYPGQGHEALPALAVNYARENIGAKDDLTSFGIDKKWSQAFQITQEPLQFQWKTRKSKEHEGKRKKGRLEMARTWRYLMFGEFFKFLWKESIIPLTSKKLKKDQEFKPIPPPPKKTNILNSLRRPKSTANLGLG